MSFISALADKYPNLKKDLKKARIDKTPEEIIRSSLKTALTYGLGLSALFFFLADSQDWNLLWVLVFTAGSLYAFYQFGLMKVKGEIINRRKEINKDVLFAGRYLLVKLNSGQPLINALVEASRSEGMANKYFKKIVRDIKTGKPIEEALREASEYSPSDKMKKILFQISNALEIGIDVTEFLEATLEEIAEQQLIEIQRYGKKLSSVTLFYMLVGVVFPSLGFTIFIVVAGLTDFATDWLFFTGLLMGLAMIQFIFIVVYKSIRPNINI